MSTDELKTFRKCFSDLNLAIRSDVIPLAEKLFSVGLITSENLNVLSNTNISEVERASKLLSLVLTKITLSARNYHVFVKVLISERDTYKEVLKNLEPIYKEPSEEDEQPATSGSLPAGDKGGDTRLTELAPVCPLEFSDDLSPNRLADWLSQELEKKGLSLTSHMREKLTEDHINGAAFKGLTENELKAMEFKLGFRKNILAIISEIAKPEDVTEGVDTNKAVALSGGSSHGGAPTQGTPNGANTEGVHQRGGGPPNPSSGTATENVHQSGGPLPIEKSEGAVGQEEANKQDSGYEYNMDDLIYRCNCGSDCSLHDYLSGSGCQKPTTKGFQYLQLPSYSYEAAQLEIALSKQSKVLAKDFVHVNIDTFQRLNKISFEDVKQYAKHMIVTGNYKNVTSGHQPVTTCIAETTTLEQLEDVLMRNHYSWFNYALLKNLRRNFLFPEGTDDLLQNYEEKFSHYCKRRCFESPLLFHPRPVSVNLTSLVFKVDKMFGDYTLIDVQQITKIVADVINSPKHAICVKSVREGCVEVSCYILPQFQLRHLSDLQISQLKENDIFSFRMEDKELLPPCRHHLYHNDNLEQPESFGDLEGYDASREESDSEDTPSIISKDGTFEAADDREDKDFDIPPSPASPGTTYEESPDNSAFTSGSSKFKFSSQAVATAASKWQNGICRHSQPQSNHVLATTKEEEESETDYSDKEDTGYMIQLNGKVQTPDTPTANEATDEGASTGVTPPRTTPKKKQESVVSNISSDVFSSGDYSTTDHDIVSKFDLPTVSPQRSLKVLESNNFDIEQRQTHSVVKRIRQLGEQLLKLCKDGCTAEVGVFKSLLDQGADPNIQDEYGHHLLWYSSWYGRADVVKLFLQYKADVNMRIENGETTLLAASEHGHTDVVNLLLEHGAVVDILEKNGETALVAACKHGHTDVVNLLLQHGAMVDIQDKDGKTALHHASHRGHTDVVKLLLDSGAQIDNQDKVNERDATLTVDDIAYMQRAVHISEWCSKWYNKGLELGLIAKKENTIEQSQCGYMASSSWLKNIIICLGVF